ncbi:DUF1007 family protein [Octadecabacter ascidiaceicola]|uniref:Polyphosphate kinase n=1 Tax=Octadecabacter ascidiaceicola TaxID=1655543 RepID=A0A238KA52_9RHOB|nr:DUF1007 family protein [Octadecabacter ascidiaceicola]SMX39695.1 hypothetical protein OCA8868_02084 [Octadecabacter ascidiaceicola]
MIRLLFTSLVFFAATATAHPHIFVSVGVTVVYDTDTPVAVRLDWEYDEYFSLLLTTDLGIDADGDLVLSAEEQAILVEAIAAWPEDYNGDLEVSQNGRAATLSGRTQHGVVMESGIIRETHTRPIAALPDPSAPLTVQVYDPFYYVSYSLNGPVKIEGRDDCTASVVEPDLNAAYSLVDELLYGRPASDVGPEEDFPEVGISFAETITITCAG